MIKKTLTYNNFGKDTTKDFYFGLFEADFMDLEVLWEDKGGWNGILAIIKEGDDTKFIMDTFKLLIARSFGVREGNEFYRPELEREKFLTSDAYSKLFMGLMTLPGDEWDASQFMVGILPDNIRNGNMDGTTSVSSQSAREKSEAQLQGFQKRQPQNQDAGFVAVPDEPLAPVAPSPAPDVTNMNDDPEWIAFQELQKQAQKPAEPELTPEQKAYLDFKASQRQQ